MKKYIENDAVAKSIEAKDAASYIGEVVSIISKAYSTEAMDNMNLVYLGSDYPNQLLTIVLQGESKIKRSRIDGMAIRVIGKLIDYKGKPGIIVTNPKDFSVVITVGTNKGGGRKGG